MESDDLLIAMSEVDARQILEQVASGQLTPDQAEQRLGGGSGDPGPGPYPGVGVSPGVGEWSEAEAEAEVEAEVEAEAVERGSSRTTDTTEAMEIAAATEPSAAAGAADNGGTSEPEVRTIKAVLSGGGLIQVLGDDAAEDAHVDGPASVSVWTERYRTRITGDVNADAVLLVPAGVHLELEANGTDVTVDGFHGTLDAVFNVSTARVNARIDRGESRIYANCSTLDVELAAGSDVIVTQKCAARMDATVQKSGRGQWTVGDGAGRLELAGNLGSIALNAE
ncbi:MAG TPA: hypothetical protein VHC49_26670 [Mycobacteriales bacterium]|nr:hypothetical protein [Mycobacteriales bacterium]